MTTHPLAVPEILTLVGECLPPLIADQLFGPPHCEFMPRDLLSCCLVSRFWRATLLPVLWRHYHHQAMFFVPTDILLKNSVYFRTYRGSNIFVEDTSKKPYDNWISPVDGGKTSENRKLSTPAPKPSVCSGLHSLYLYEKRLRVRRAVIATQDPSVVYGTSSSLIAANHVQLRKLAWDWDGFYQSLDFCLAAYITPTFAACANLTDLALLNMRITSVEALWNLLSPIAAQLTSLNLRGVSFDKSSVQDRDITQDTQVWVLPRITDLAISLDASNFVDCSPLVGGHHLREERIIQACPQVRQLTVLMGTEYNVDRLNATFLDAREPPGKFSCLRSFTSETPYSEVKPYAKLLETTGQLCLEELNIVCSDNISDIQEVCRAIVHAHRNSLTRLCLRIVPDTTEAEYMRRDLQETVIENSENLGYHLRWLLEAMSEMKDLKIVDKSYSRIASVVLDALVVGPEERGSSGNAEYQERRDAILGSSMCAWACHGLESLSIQVFTSFQFEVNIGTQAEAPERRLEHGWKRPDSKRSADLKEDCLGSLQALLNHVSPILSKLKEIDLQGGNVTQQAGDAKNWELERSYELLTLRNNEIIRSIVDPENSDSHEVPEGEAVNRNILRKLQDYYKSCMDESLIEKRGATPLVKEIGKILELFPVSQSPFDVGDSPDRNAMEANGSVDRTALSKTLAHFNRMNLEMFSSFQPLINPWNPKAWIIQLQGARTKEATQYTRHDTSYLAAIAGTFEEILVNHTSIPSPSLKSSTALNNNAPGKWLRAANFSVQFEKKLSNISDVNLKTTTYHLRSIDEIAILTPFIDWRYFLDNTLPSGINYTRPINVKSLDYQRCLEDILHFAKPVELQSYFIWMLIRQLEHLIPPKYIAPMVRSIDLPKNRSKYCLWAIQEDLSEPLTHFYVQRAFEDTTRYAAEKMVNSVRTSVRKSIYDLAWFDDSTRDLAIEKIDKLVAIIGYDPSLPLSRSSWSLSKRYLDYTVKTNDYFGNRLGHMIWSSNDLFSKVNSHVDRRRHDNAPMTPDFFYSNRRNLLLLPAGYLQPPFFHHKYPAYVNFGSMGILVAHEFTVLKIYFVFVDVYIFALEAGMMVKAAKSTNTDDNDMTLPGLEKYTFEQLFFLSYAQVWCQKHNPGFLEWEAKFSTHSPDEWRVNGVLRNSEDFATAFKCKSDTPMNPREKCRLW
ncbi:Neprilysin-4 [Mortierella alpina]|nr:Neprilysin-4 [Mortierella alpina]